MQTCYLHSQLKALRTCQGHTGGGLGRADGMKALRQEQSQVFCEKFMMVQSFNLPLLWSAANSGAPLTPWKVRAEPILYLDSVFAGMISHSWFCSNLLHSNLLGLGILNGHCCLLSTDHAHATILSINSECIRSGWRQSMVGRVPS